MKPFVKVGHRNGHVFLQIVSGGKTMGIRLEPDEAAKFADDVKDAAYRTSKKPHTIGFPMGPRKKAK